VQPTTSSTYRVAQEIEKKNLVAAAKESLAELGPEAISRWRRAWDTGEGKESFFSPLPLPIRAGLALPGPHPRRFPRVTGSTQVIAGQKS
jgi:hypothetical protein